MDLFKVDKIVLKKARIENYRMIENDEIEFGDKGIVFSGENGIGKTTRIEAILWVLTDTLFDNSTNGLASLLKPNGSDINTLTSVELTFYDGYQDTVIMKTLKEKWVKKRGTEDIVLEGVEQKHYVNGVELNTKKEFQNRINSLFGLNSFINFANENAKLVAKINFLSFITNIEYFKTIDNKTLRELVISIGGTVDLDILEMTDSLRGLLSKQSNDFDNAKKFLKKQIKDTQDKIDKCASNIEYLKKKLETIPTPEVSKRNENRIEEIRKEIAKLEYQLQQGEKELVREIELELQQKQLDLEKYRLSKQENTQENDQEGKLKEQLDTLNQELKELLNERELLKQKSESLFQTIGLKENLLEELKERGKNVVEKRKQLEQENKITCPHCNMPFDLPDMEEHKLEIAKEIKELSSRIVQIKKDIETLKQENVKLITSQSELSTKISIKQTEFKELQDKISLLTPKRNLSTVIVPTNDFYDEHELGIISDINTLKTRKNDVSLEYSLSQQVSKTKKLSLETELDKLISENKLSNEFDLYNDNLSAENNTFSTLTKELVDYERLDIELKMVFEKYLLVLDEKVKDTFGENIRFKLFENNVSNENISAICDMMVKDSQGRWVNMFNGINTGHAVPRMIEFISRVKKHFGVHNSIILLDYFETVGNQSLQECLSFDEQLITTQVVRGQNEIKKENL